MTNNMVAAKWIVSQKVLRGNVRLMGFQILQK